MDSTFAVAGQFRPFCSVSTAISLKSRRSSEAVPFHSPGDKMFGENCVCIVCFVRSISSTTAIETGSVSSTVSTTSSRLTRCARSTVPLGHRAPSHAIAQIAKSAIRGSKVGPISGKVRNPCANTSNNAPKIAGRSRSKLAHSSRSVNRRSGDIGSNEMKIARSPSARNHCSAKRTLMRF
jgi:hypothetical protein